MESDTHKGGMWLEYKNIDIYGFGRLEIKEVYLTLGERRKKMICY